MKLHELPAVKGSNKNKKRKGMGPGSGNGKTAGRGHKGAKSRSGYSMPTNYSGIPWYRRLPQKKGFSNFKFKTEYDVVNLQVLEAIQGVDTIDRNVLVQAGILRNSSIRFKVLGEGELTKPLTIIADKFTASAKTKIEAAGGKAQEFKAKSSSEA